MSWFFDFFEKKTKDNEYVCPIHGQVKQAIKLKNIGELDGLYCAKCQAEFWARTLRRVKVLR